MNDTCDTERPTRWCVSRMDSQTEPLWDSFARSHPQANVFHSSSWLRFLEEFCQAPVYMLLGTQNGRVVGGLPLVCRDQVMMGRRLLSVPYTDRYVALIQRHDCESAASALLSFAHERGAGAIEVKETLCQCRHTRVVGTWHEVDLSGGAKVAWQRCSTTQIKQRVRKNERVGAIRVETRRDVDALKVFFDLHVATRRRLRALWQPWAFFKLLWQWVGEAGHVYVKIARAGDSAVAAAVFIHDSQYVCYKYSASLIKYWPLHPNHILLWNAIEDAAERGMRSLDLGRTGGHNAGLRNFKRSWGAYERELAYWCPEWRGTLRRRMAATLHRRAGRMLSVMPTCCARSISEVVYPRLT